MAEKPEISCCAFCGSDTTAVDKICFRCLSNKRRGSPDSEYFGRKSRDLTGLEDREPADKDTAEYRYHGDNYGDDC